MIARRFRGPPDSANGGYACGVVGKRLGRIARVTLRSPPPLEVPLLLQAGTAGSVTLVRGEHVVADGIAAELQDGIPDPVSVDIATSASENYAWAAGHPFPGCFVCGPERDAGDGLCIFPGPVPGRSVVAAAWVPDRTVCDRRGQVHVEVMWAALDCPSWFGLLAFEPGARVALLGQLTVWVRRCPAAGSPCVVMGWSRGREGRKLYGGAAVYSSGGNLLGRSEAVWIEPRT